MKIKTINRVIKKKMDEWLATLPPALKEEVKPCIIVTGGCIASMLLKEPVNDYDLYFTDKEVLVKLVEHYLSGTGLKTWDGPQVQDEVGAYIDPDPEPDRVRICIPSAGAKEFPKVEGKQYTMAYVTENAITLTDQVQLVTRFIGDACTIHSNYDFVHAMNYWTYLTDLMTRPEALESLITRELVYDGSKYPICSIIRTRKFIARGFTINAGQYLKMCMQVSKLDLTDIQVLRDQLIGVDSAYFQGLISSLEAKQKTYPGCLENQGYLAGLIDHIFANAKEDLVEGDADVQ